MTILFTYSPVDLSGVAEKSGKDFQKPGTLDGYQISGLQGPVIATSPVETMNRILVITGTNISTRSYP